MKPRITRAPFFVYPVKSLARARRFYAGVLGLKPGERWGTLWQEFEVPRGPAIAVATQLKGCRPGAQGGAAALESDRFDEVVAALRRRRVKFLFGPTDTGVCDFARFEDPDGNPVILHRKHRRRRN